jgi:hypothetical protein
MLPLRASRYLVLSTLVTFLGVGTAQAQVLYGAIGGSATTSDLYTVDTTTGDTTSIGPIGFSVTGLASDPFTGDLYGVTAGGGTRNLLVIDRSTGGGTAVGSTGSSLPDISFRPNGTLYAWLEAGAGSDDLATVSTSTAAVIVVGDSGLSTFGSGLAFNDSGVG